MKKMLNFFMIFCVMFFCTGMEIFAAGETRMPQTDSVSVNVLAEQTKEHHYTIYVNKAWNCVTVMDTDASGNEIPVRAFACSCGRPGHASPSGTLQTSDYYVWREMIDGSHARYAVRFSGHILFHSVPYYTRNVSDLEYDEYNKLGEPASLGCIRLSVEDAKWIYENTTPGTTVIVYYDATTPGPLGKPDSIRIDTSSPYRGWDPTDTDPNNPWLTVYGITPEYLAFDELAYAAAYPDLMAAFGTNEQMLWNHYPTYGMAEGRVAVFR